MGKSSKRPLTLVKEELTEFEPQQPQGMKVHQTWAKVPAPTPFCQVDVLPEPESESESEDDQLLANGMAVPVKPPSFRARQPHPGQQPQIPAPITPAVPTATATPAPEAGAPAFKKRKRNESGSGFHLAFSVEELPSMKSASVPNALAHHLKVKKAALKRVQRQQQKYQDWRLNLPQKIGQQAIAVIVWRDTGLPTWLPRV